MFEDIWNWLEQTIGQFRDFVVANYGNPLMWLVFFFIGIGLFYFTYNALTKHKQ